jgi:hypothetical protein
MPECLFCERPAGSKEHIFPQWILKRKKMRFSKLELWKRSGIIYRGDEYTTRMVCGKCNNGWMADLDSEAIPVLSPMFDGEHVQLREDQQRLISVWMAKMAIIQESTKGRDVVQRFYTNEETRRFRIDRLIPAITKIWVGRIDIADRRNIGATEIKRASQNGYDEIRATTVFNEHFVSQIVTQRSMDGIEIEPKPGDWGYVLISIWPIQSPVALWPPAHSFTNYGSTAVDYLRGRWLLGENQE